jgi:hypothetical protein
VAVIRTYLSKLEKGAKSYLGAGDHRQARYGP